MPNIYVKKINSKKQITRCEKGLTTTFNSDYPIKKGDILILDSKKEKLKCIITDTTTIDAYKKLVHFNKDEINIKDIKSILLDTNIIIQRESWKGIDNNILNLFKMIDDLNLKKFILEDTIDELSRINSKDMEYENFVKKVNTCYTKISSNKIYSNFFTTVTKQLTSNVNDEFDNNLLNLVFEGKMEALVTNDKKIIKKAELLGIKNRVFSTMELLIKFQNEFPNKIDYKFTEFRLKKFHEIDFSQDFFDSLKSDYDDFNGWITKKIIADESAYVIQENGQIKTFFYIKLEDETEIYDFAPNWEKQRRVKIGSLKSTPGYSIIERMLKISFDFALQNNAKEIYVTLYEQSSEEIKKLISILETWGFKKQFVSSGGETIMVKSMVAYDDTKDPKYNYPLMRENIQTYMLFINPEFHTIMFPELITKKEKNVIDMSKTQRNNSLKTYIFNGVWMLKSGRNIPKPGDRLVIYRSGENFSLKRYTSCVTGEAILYSFNSIKNLEELSKIKKKLVLDEETLHEKYGSDEEILQKCVCVKLLYLNNYKNKVIRDVLLDNKIIEDKSRNFYKISKDKYDKLEKLVKGE